MGHPFIKHSIMNRHMMKHHYFHCLNKKEKMCIAGIIAVTFIRGICIGLYLNNK